MAAQASPGAAVAVIKRMFEDPIPRLLPSDTLVSQFIEGNDDRYSPERWADPLLLSKWQIGVEEDIVEVMPATRVLQNMPFRQYMQKNSPSAKPHLSVFGQKLKAMYESYEFDNEEEYEFITSSADWSIGQLIKQNENQIFFNLKDEAAIVRLLLLQMMLTKPTDLMQASTLVHQIAVNMNVKEDRCRGSWSPPPVTSDCGRIGTETSTSALYVLAIDEINEAVLKDESSHNINPSNFVYIPVRSSWSGMSWLMAYILSFTSTSWWNHAYALDVEYSNGVPEAEEGLPMKATFMPKAATVCIPGNYSYICLVVIDATRAQFPDDWQFKVCNGITATRSGNFEFAKKAYAYLGRLSDPDVRTFSSHDIALALSNMTFMFSSAELRQLHLKASILATSRFNGYGCYPNPEPPENRAHIMGPAAFNNKDEILIGDYVVPDLTKMTEEERRTRQHVLNFWRCDPLGFFTHSDFDIQGNSQHVNQYRLSVSYNDMRILRACGVFPSDGRDMGILTDFLNTTLGYASLMLGLTNWCLVEMGYTLIEHNYILRRHLERLDWKKITSDFLIGSVFEIIESGDLSRVKHLRKVGSIMNISEQELPDQLYWLKTHFSGNVPWWFVGAIAEKFGHSFNLKTPITCYENEIGFRINGKRSGQYDLSLLTASSKYEQKVRRNRGPYFSILTQNSEAYGLTYNMISWDMNRLLDSKKSQLCKFFPRKKVEFNGIVELNVIILPKRCFSEFSQAFVASDNRIISDDQKSWPQVYGLQFYRDREYLDWLGVVSE